MEVNFIKMEYGNLVPASEIDIDSMKSIKTGQLLTLNIENKVNQLFHRKIFKLLNFCFDHWTCHNQNMSQKKQFDTFRKMMTIKAGFYSERFYPDGSVSIIPDSLAYKSGTDFPELYQSLLNVAINELFRDIDSEVKYRLYSFF